MSYLELLRLAIPEVHVTVAALIVLTIGLARPRAGAAVTAVAAVGLLLAAVAVLRLLAEATFGSSMLVVSPLTSLFKVVCIALGLITVLLAHAESRSLAHYAEYLALILFGTLGLMLLVASEELLMIFIGLELTGLSLYVLTAFRKTDRRAAEAGLKYFLFGSMASAFTLFGLSFIYGMAGTTMLSGIAAKFATAPATPLLAAGIVMTLVGFAFKIAAAPFHLWAADSYEAAPVPSAAFIASGSKVASFVVLGKIVLIGFAPVQGSAAWQGAVAGWAPVLAALAAASIVIGNFAALAQKNVRRLLAYSAVAHAGYTLLGLVAGGREGFSATLFYTTIYAVTLLGAFGIVGLVRRGTGGDDFTHFASLRTRSPLLAACMAVFLLSLAGLPPLAGFFGKFYLFSAVMNGGGNQGLVWLVALALFGSLVSLYYYVIVLKLILVDDTDTEPTRLQIHWLQRLTVAVLAIGVLMLGVMPSPLVSRIMAAIP